MTRRRTTTKLAPITCALVLATLLRAPVHAAVQDDELASAAASARNGAETSEGKQYAEAVGQAFGREHGSTIQQCAKGAKRHDLSNFDIFVRLDGTGVADRALVEPATTLSTCVQGRLAGWKAPVPGTSGTWVKIAVNLKGR